MKWILFTTLALSPLSAFAGNELGNGGDSYAQEFVTLGRRMVDELAAVPDPKVKNLPALRQALDTTSVHSTGRLDLNGHEVDAVNYPTLQRIEFDRDRWKEYSVEQRSSLALHEYLGIAGESDEHYQISSAFVEEETPSNWVHPRATASAVRNSNVATLESEEKPGLLPGFSLELGTGITSHTGNINKLYGSVGVPMEARIGIQIAPELRIRLGVEKSSFSFLANLGSVDVSTLNAVAGIEYHPFTLDRGLDPYAVGLLTNTWRKQDYNQLGQVMNDTALGFLAGVGLGVELTKQFAIWIEGDIGNQFFADRFEQTYAPVGVPDLTGLVYTASAGIRARF